ncbi:acyltransferase family protein [Clostridium sp.]|uniref:acyltransferase family protein n=1 Tax=Clostridium sp. TaxID=1506 RepID=UPI003D6D8843
MEQKNIVNSNSEKGRLKCIDAIRGMAVALMLLADNPGNTARIYPQLRHAKWNGCTVADLGFPFFIIIMGMVVPYALNRRIEKGISPFNIFAHILSRSIGIFLLGLFLNGFPLYNFSSIRILGVLQRIAIIYLIVSSLTLLILYLVKNKVIQASIQLGLAFIIIIVYYLLMKHVSVPGFGKGILEQNGNLVQYIDLHWLKGHLYKPNWDPEGILSTLPAIASGLFGAVTGQILIYTTDKKIYKFLSVFTFGLITLALACKANIWFPFNKNLWSSSFVLLTAGICILLTAVLYFLMDIIKYDSIFKPFVTLGSSAIFVYLVSEIVRKTLWVIPILDPLTKKTVTLNVWLTTHCITPWAGNILDSAYFSIVYIVLWTLIMSIFYDKKSFMRL